MTFGEMIGAATAVGVGLAVYQQKRAESKLEAAEKARKEAEDEAIKERLAVKVELTKNTAATQDVQHKVNGWLAEVLRSMANDKRRIANLTKDPHDEALAIGAEKRLADHEAEQRRVAAEAAAAAAKAMAAERKLRDEVPAAPGF